MPDGRCRTLRRCLARREQLIRGRTRAKTEIQAVLQRRLQPKPGFADLFGATGRRWLADLELPVEERESIDAGLRQIAFLDDEIAAVDKLIARQALDWPEIRRLMTVSGVKLIFAVSFLAAIGDPSRFMSSRKLVAYLGLDPKVRQSGEAPARQAGSPSAGQPTRGGRWSRRRGAWSSTPAHCARSTNASALGAVTAKRSSRPPANSPSCSGACSPAQRTAPTSVPLDA
jgi:transposase